MALACRRRASAVLGRTMGVETVEEAALPPAGAALLAIVAFVQVEVCFDFENFLNYD